MTRVAVINGICVEHDAISESVLGTVKALQLHDRFDVRLFTYSSDFDDIPTTIVRDVADLILDPFYLTADVLIFHFGVYYELFNAILIGNARGRRVVVYHNITPKEFLPVEDAFITERSLIQRANILAADAVWAVSRYNERDMIEYGVSYEKISLLPLYVRFPPELSKKQLLPVGQKVEILYVGRFVRSKGVIDLVKAVKRLRDGGARSFVLRMAGNLTFSDAEYIKELRKLITRCNLEDLIIFEGKVADERLLELYRQAQIFALPSYHEGFCVPILEALFAGCVPVVYASGNIPDLVGTLGTLVSPGDVDGLTHGLESVLTQFDQGQPEKITLQGLTRSWAQYRNDVNTLLRSYTYSAFADKVTDGIDKVLTIEI
jgi:glycosyltransferase involved in cell wall biosynthesis